LITNDKNWKRITEIAVVVLDDLIVSVA